MTEQEQIEVWQWQFYEEMKKISAVNFTFVAGLPIVEPRSGKSSQLVVGVAWSIFKSAKRTMPVIELPTTNWNPLLMGHFYSHGEAVKAITAAGYQYKIKGE